MTRFLATYGLYLGWLVALVATGGSLYFSEIAGFVPCKLCWFQRILMYPLVIWLGMASFRDDRRIAGYVLPLSSLGGAVAAFHYAEQKVPGIGSGGICGTGAASCSVEWINGLGFVTIPFLSLLAFALITTLTAFVLRAHASTAPSRRGPGEGSPEGSSPT